MLILGIDEAGRGPVIGSLFLAGVLMDELELYKLEELKVKDSKLLTHKKRLEFEKEIKKIAKYKVIKVTPVEIDHAVNKEDGLNLNWLEAKKTADLINELKPDVVILDCPSPNINAYTNYLKKLVNKKVEIIADHKADVKYKIVSAASILAKCDREREVAQIKKEYGDIGPGYCANPITQKFLKENWDKHPEIFRKSWMPWQDHKIAKEQKKLDAFE